MAAAERMHLARPRGDFWTLRHYSIIASLRLLLQCQEWFWDLVGINAAMDAGASIYYETSDRFSLRAKSLIGTGGFLIKQKQN